ncbi:DUF397 domain-containing protein [Lentzea sp. NPDC059081]|uniref:DUF397 domain-containing protein n=1 Tax=Lentzea sp. NPDC059081 TaxID=3346719 RepID=UPI0036AC1B7B
MWSKATDLTGVRWRTSSFTNGGADPQCVEVAPVGAVWAVRHSLNPSGPALGFSESAFRALIEDVKRGDGIES